MSVYIDIGVDHNKDNHCDIEGYFLNRHKMHKPIARETGRKSWDMILEERRQFRIMLDSTDYFEFPFSGVSREREDALFEYTKNDASHTSSPSINGYLRNGGEREYSTIRAILTLDSLADSIKLKKDLFVFRGVGGSLSRDIHVAKLARLAIGDVYSDCGFMSTSTSMFKACDYADFDNNNTVVIAKIILPKGTKCAPVYVNKKNESEILLPRGSSFKVIGKNAGYIDGRIVVSLTMEKINENKRS